MKKRFTLSIFTENTVGLTNKITIIFTRRRLNIESLTTSASEVEGVHRFTIVLETTEEAIEKLVKQIEKVIDVIKCFYYEDKEIFFQEIALYKVAVSGLQDGNKIEQIVRANHARILAVKPDFIIIEKTGHEHETHALYEELKPYGLLQFARSGRIALSESVQNVSELLKEYEQ
ncbi:acetolactate synthase small subunit [Rapidithrix thailandica]|uniref:Acetolactate synthase small subunit n=1 Tax=Rapidithrix thailandica TaxID=413964 RepID=A0AAW9SG52_9BACT